MEKYREGQKALHCVFVDLEKAYAKGRIMVLYEEVWKERYVRLIQDMYENSTTVVKCAVGRTEDLKVEVGLHQGSALSQDQERGH